MSNVTETKTKTWPDGPTLARHLRDRGWHNRPLGLDVAQLTDDRGGKSRHVADLIRRPDGSGYLCEIHREEWGPVDGKTHRGISSGFLVKRKEGGDLVTVLYGPEDDLQETLQVLQEG